MTSDEENQVRERVSRPMRADEPLNYWKVILTLIVAFAVASCFPNLEVVSANIFNFGKKAEIVSVSQSTLESSRNIVIKDPKDHTTMDELNKQHDAKLPWFNEILGRFHSRQHAFA
jgi:hypothetical protein